MTMFIARVSKMGRKSIINVPVVHKTHVKPGDWVWVYTNPVEKENA